MHRFIAAALALAAVAASDPRANDCPNALESSGVCGWAASRGDASESSPANTPNPLPALVHDGDAVFFVGNSFLGWEGRMLPEWLGALGLALSPPIRIETGFDIVCGNTPLSGFLQHAATREALASRKYAVFVLQGEEYEPVDHTVEFHQAVRDFDRAVRAAGGRTVLFMTWQFRWRPFIDRLAASYDEIGRELGIPVIPVGLIYADAEETPLPHQTRFWLTASTEQPQGDLHENVMGTAVNTYATFAMLTGTNPLGRNFMAPGNTNSGTLMRALSDMAWARVRPRLESTWWNAQPGGSVRAQAH